MTIEEIKKQLDELTKAVNEISEQDTTEKFVFTKEQMIAFVTELVNNIEETVGEAVRSYDIDDDVVELSMDYGREISVNIDTHSITSGIMDEIDLNMSEDDIIDTVNEFFSR